LLLTNIQTSLKIKFDTRAKQNQASISFDNLTKLESR